MIDKTKPICTILMKELVLFVIIHTKSIVRYKLELGVKIKHKVKNNKIDFHLL